MDNEKTSNPNPESAGLTPPGLLQMIRAPFLSSIIAPLLAGTLLSVSINGFFLPVNFFLMLIIGIGLHAAVNVYNDIYDTIQGTDAVNVHRNEASGGSGILQAHPELMGKMFFIARAALVVALLATAALLIFIDRALWPHLIFLYLLSAFFSKYYTAPPFKLAYRGLGEISVWFAFGPMAILIAAVSQNIGLHPYVVALMPATGLSTSSILLVGQMIDLDADRKRGQTWRCLPAGYTGHRIVLFARTDSDCGQPDLFGRFPGCPVMACAAGATALFFPVSGGSQNYLQTP